MPSQCPKCGTKFAGRTIGTHAAKCGVTYDMLFWQKVDKRGPDECWPWTGALNTRRYGTLAIRRRMQVAPRAMWELTHGPIPKGLLVMHTCDNPPCVNPAHLRLGTDADNAADKMRKGRHHSIGEENVHAKLTNEQAKAIYARYKRNGRRSSNAAELAAEFKCEITAIHNIGTGRTWWSVTGAPPARRVPKYLKQEAE